MAGVRLEWQRSHCAKLVILRPQEVLVAGQIPDRGQVDENNVMIVASGRMTKSTFKAPTVVLAPMSGVTDLPFRQLAHRLGAPCVVSEMVASEDLVAERRHVVRRMESDGISPRVVQLAGREARWMAEGARMAADAGADVIDINMGCPAREVTGKLSGSALMRDLDHAQSLLEAVVGAVNVPVTLKMRLGWDSSQLNAAELGRRAEACGIAMLTVHGRTRCQFFTGAADWSAVRAVVEAVTLPVLVNGDICSPADARKAMMASGASGVMVGRGAYGAPWLPARISAALSTGRDPGCPPLAEQAAIAVGHVAHMIDYYGPDLGIRNARKHIGWYLLSAGCPDADLKAWRRRLCTSEDRGAVLDGLAAFYAWRMAIRDRSPVADSCAGGVAA